MTKKTRWQFERSKHFNNTAISHSVNEQRRRCKINLLEFASYQKCCVRNQRRIMAWYFDKSRSLPSKNGNELFLKSLHTTNWLNAWKNAAHRCFNVSRSLWIRCCDEKLNLLEFICAISVGLCLSQQNLVLFPHSSSLFLPSSLRMWYYFRSSNKGCNIS